MNRKESMETQNKQFMEGFSRVLGPALVLALVALNLLRGSYDLALLTISAVIGWYLGKFVAEILRHRGALKLVAAVAGVVCIAIAVPGVAGLLPVVEVRNFGLWQPLFALLAASLPGLLLGSERLTEFEKFRVMLELYRCPDGSRWDGQKIEEATNGEVDAEYFSKLERGRVALPSLDKQVAMSWAMDFPSELWMREPEWWQNVLAERNRGRDVGDRLREWNCFTPEQAAKELGVFPEDVLAAVEVGELEGRRGREGNWQIRAFSVDEKMFEKDNVKPTALPPWNRDARPGRTGSGRFPDHRGSFKGRKQPAGDSARP